MICIDVSEIEIDEVGKGDYMRELLMVIWRNWIKGEEHPKL